VVGLALTVKPGVGAAVTVIVAVAVCWSDPLVPVIVNV
jgi:hypothetical protein